jgi:trimeric autotransporter adhesin
LTTNVTINFPSLGPATGTVILSGGTYASPATALVNGSASFTVPANSFPVGNSGLTATYSGDTNYLAGSLTEYLVVNPVPVPDIAMTGTNLSLAAGATTGNTSTITITPAGGFTGAVTLTASITAGPNAAHDPPTVSFGSTSPVNISGTTAATATLTVSTTASTTSCTASLESRPKAPWLGGGGTVLALMVLFGIPAKRRTWRRMLGMLSLLIAVAAGVTACGGGGGGNKPCTPTSVPGTTPGAYTATVTATAGTITKTATVTITVN